MIRTLDDFVDEFRKIKNMGWIPTHRAGPTGIGKTLEDLLGIVENNADKPDFGEYELKSMRTNATSMLTIFTKTPEPPRANGVLLQKYGYRSTEVYGNDSKVLHATLSADRFTSVRGTNQLKISCEKDGIYFESQEGLENIYYRRETLQRCFNRKYRGIFVYAYADSKGRGRTEAFHFVKAYAVSGFSYDEFAELLEKGVIKIDIRIGQYPDGRIHDHGTGFRIRECDQVLLFRTRTQIV
ncbi:MAG: MvaI/BcnI family restriction endonuclease [Clostridiales bacterium]|nr:MvaI/BcnI family restriction endonuclease [Clostridiales bacterium]